MKKFVLYSLCALLFVIMMYYFSKWNFVLFHLIIEDITLLIGLTIFIISLLSRKLVKSNFTTTIGPGILVASIIIFLHALMYKGMNIIGQYDSDLPTQLWIIANYIQASAFLVGAIFVNRKYNYKITMTSFLIVGVTFTTLAFARVFPSCFIEGEGLTLFKIISEYLIIFIYLLAIYVLNKKRVYIGNSFTKSIIYAIAFFIVGELFFTLYIDVFGINNFLGHIFRLFGFIIIYNVMIVKTVNAPLDTIFTNLSLKVEETKNAEENLKLAQSIAKVGSWELMLDTQIMWASEEAFKIYEIERISDFIDISIIQSMVDQKDREILNHALKDLVQFDKPYNVTFKMDTASGKVKYINSRATLKFDQENNPIKVVGAIHDITELKEKELKLESLAYSDFLTGIHNRRRIFEDLDKSWRLCIREKFAISFVMIDIDDFKSYNDNCGHIIGDKALIDIANEIKSSLSRPFDDVGRIGGEEFLVLLPKTNFESAIKIAEKIRKSVIDLKIKSCDKCDNDFLTISLGVCTVTPTNEIAYEKVINCADEALFEAKNDGKNTVKGKQYC